MPDEIRRAGRYEIVEKIGSGGMGSVYRANDPAIGRPVAVKAIGFGDVADPGQRRDLQIRIAREARSAGLLSHPNIVMIHDVGRQSGVAYIVMELVEGPTLWSYFSTKGRLDKSVLLSVVKQAAALDYAHQNGIIHRDVKPSNILLRPDGVVKLTDFGVAKILSAEQLTRTGLMVGTPNYMSPEQVREQGVTPASDQFGLAVIAYECLTGRKPFEDKKLPRLLMQIVNDPHPPCSSLNPKLPVEVDQVLDRALAKKPAERYESCAEFAAALETALAAVGEEDLGERRKPVRVELEPEPEKPREAKGAAPAIGPERVKTAPLRKVSGDALEPVGSPGETWEARLAALRRGFTERDPRFIGAAAALGLALAALIFALVGGQSPSQAPAAASESVVAEPAPAPGAGSAVPEIALDAPPPAPLPAAPRRSYGPTLTMIWRGELAPNEELTIEGDQASVGSVNLEFPGEPVEVEVSPAAVEIVEAPSAANDWRVLRLKNGPNVRTLIFVRYKTYQ